MKAGFLHKNHKTPNRLKLNKRQCVNSQGGKYVKPKDSTHSRVLHNKNDTHFPHWKVFQIVALLKCCARSREKERGCLLHDQIAGDGSLQKNILVGTALVDMYAKFGMLAKAQDVFDKLPNRDVVLWNALISGYTQHGWSREALDCFERMKSQGFSLDEVTFACSLKACAVAKAIEKGEGILAEIKKEGLLAKSQIVGNAVVDMYAKCGLLENARQLFDMLPVRNLVTWNALITGYAQNEHGEEAVDCYEKMKVQEIFPDAVTYACVLKACGTIGARDKGQEIHGDIEKIGFLRSDQIVSNALIDMYGKCGLLVKAFQLFNDLHFRDVVSWNALIAGYVHNERGEEALNCFEQMRLQGLSPSAVTFACCLKACGCIGAMARSTEIHAHIAHSGLLKSNQVVGNALVDVYAKFGVLEKAQEVFDILPNRNIVSWNSLLTGYAQLGEVECVLDSVSRMREDGFDPNLVTFRIILGACRHAGLVEKGLTYFEEMSRTHGIGLLMKHQGCIVDLLSRAGQLEFATAITKDAPAHPSNVMWLTVLGACQKWGNKNLGDEAFEQAVPLCEDKAAAHVSLYNIYADVCTRSECMQGGH